MREFTHNLVIKAPPAAILDAFFDAEALGIWWGASGAVCTPRPLGSYAIEWPATNWRDDVLGPLGGSLHGTVMEFRPGQEFFVAELYWMPPEGDPIGPMSLEATCTQDGDGVLLQLRQSGHDPGSERWSRYYDVVVGNWLVTLEALRCYLENRWG